MFSINSITNFRDVVGAISNGNSIFLGFDVLSNFAFAQNEFLGHCGKITIAGKLILFSADINNVLPCTNCAVLLLPRSPAPCKNKTTGYCFSFEKFLNVVLCAP